MKGKEEQLGEKTIIKRRKHALSVIAFGVSLFAAIKLSVFFIGDVIDQELPPVILKLNLLLYKAVFAVIAIGVMSLIIRNQRT